jgi:lipopolysaccharide biosynthesis protein
MKKNNILVVYAYYEKDNIYKNNLEFFLKRGLCSECDYIFVINGECSVHIPNRLNIKVLKRENQGYDFGAYNEALQLLTNIDDYQYFIFLNTSVRGPFIPTYVKMQWYEPFINLLKDDIKLVGTTMNILNSSTSEHSQIFYNHTGFPRPHTHIQSQMFVVDKECLKYLVYMRLFSSNNYTNMTEFIALKEIMMSQLVLKKGWNISCIIPEYQEIDYRLLEYDINPTSFNNDPCFQNSCFGRTIHPYDVIFIKTNRGISINEINSLSKQQ